ncbi:hypothetical protein WJX82_005330 [Trebouxia sp. C0006]
MAMSSQQEAACVCVHITAKATSFPYREASRDAAVFAVAISAGFLAHLDPFGNLHWDSMDAVQGLAWAGPNIAVDDIARDQAAQAKFAAERQALHMSPEEPFALLGQSSPGEEVSPGIHQKEVTVTQQQAAWRDGLGKWRWDRANKEPRVAVQMPLPTVYSMVSVVASEMLLRAVTLADVSRQLRQHPEAERQRIEQKTQSCLQDITYKKNTEQKISIAADIAQQAVRAFTLSGSYVTTGNLLASIVAAAVADFPLQIYLQSHMQDVRAEADDMQRLAEQFQQAQKAARKT